MKKIIMVCSIFVLLLALSVPTFAADTDDPYGIIGRWYLNDTITINGGFVMLFEHNGITYDRFLKNGSDGYDYRFSYGFSGNSLAVYSSGWLDESYRTINVIGYSDKTTEEYANILKANATYLGPASCDGSTCPATDVNYDGVCDDCGMALTMSIRPYPPVDGLWDKAAYPYGLLYMRNDNIPSLYFLDNPITTTDGVDFRFNGGNFVVYNLVDGVWTYERTGQGAVEFPDLDSGRILKVSHDVNFQGAILMYKDADFFPTPLWETVEQVTQGTMQEEIPKMGGTMTILVACGVGLMACLVVLSLFGKRSLISRS